MPRNRVTGRRFRDAILVLAIRRMTMTVASHVQELRRKHQALSEAVEAAQRSPSASDLDISRMKKEKLRLKEEISRLTH